jgi:hypothetical protein
LIQIKATPVPACELTIGWTTGVWRGRYSVLPA